MASKTVKCGYCPWETLEWFRSGGSKRAHNGWYALRNHVEEKHPEVMFGDDEEEYDYFKYSS